MKIGRQGSTCILAIALGLMTAIGCDESARKVANDGIVPLIESQCEWLFDCCSEGELTYLVGPFTVDADNCVDRMLLSLEAGSTNLPSTIQPIFRLLDIMYELDQDRIDLDMGAIETCADSLASQQCASPPEDDDGGGTDRCVPGQVVEVACDVREMIKGKQGIGEECNPASGLECKKGLRCADHGYVGICAHASDEGEYCFSDAECQDDFFCDYEDGTCARGALRGQPCAYEDPTNPVAGTESIRCAKGLSCDPDSLKCVDYCAPGALCGSDFDCPDDYFCVIGRCRLPGAEGAPCARNEDCRSEACDFATGFCLGLKPIDAACFSHDECTSRFCDPFTSLCSRGSAVGQPCPTQSHVECIGGWCDRTDPLAPICRDYLGENSPCPDPVACDSEQGLICINGLCQSLPLPNGVQCSYDDMCESDLCWQGTCQEGTPTGGQCDLSGSRKPCVPAAYCLLTDSFIGTCTPKLPAGRECDTNEQCWGQCLPTWGEQICDVTPALGTATCDGMD